MPGFLDNLTVFAPAKVNLHLAVKDKRPDGFHSIESVFLAVDFGDTLRFESHDNLIEIVMNNETEMLSVPLQENIIYKAVSLFREKTGFSKGLKIEVEKRIPLGGGLGGGSSNAAAALLALNKIAGFPLCRDTLLDIAAALGSDVSFFVHNIPAAWVTGRGEIIEPAEIPPMFLVLVIPGFPSETKTAFRLLAEHRSKKTSNSSAQIRVNPRTLKNDFLDVLDKKENGIYKQIILQLQEQGAEYANLSGAGSTCFGVFEGQKAAQKAAQALCGKWPFVQECSTNCALRQP